MKISAEWAKDNNIRKINTSDVKKWAEKINKAKKRDNGNGCEIKKVLNIIEKEVDEKLK